MLLNKHSSAIFFNTSASRGFSKNWPILDREFFRSCITMITSQTCGSNGKSPPSCGFVSAADWCWTDRYHLFVGYVQYAVFILSTQPALHVIEPGSKHDWGKYKKHLQHHQNYHKYNYKIFADSFCDQKVLLYQTDKNKSKWLFWGGESCPKLFSTTVHFTYMFLHTYWILNATYAKCHYGVKPSFDMDKST